MKLLNYTTNYFAALLFVLIAIWAIIFYITMLDEIYDSMDDGLENQKMLVLEALENDSSMLEQDSFGNRYYLFRKVTLEKVKNHRDEHFDTLIYMQTEDEFEPVRALRSAVNVNEQYYHMLLITSMVEEDDLIANLLFNVIALYIGLVATILFTNNLLLKRIWSPFYKLVDRLKGFRIDQNQLPMKKYETNIIEFSHLNDAIDRLIEKNISIYQSQKEFIENASHELQTPLAIAINRIEELLTKKEAPGDKDLLSVQDNLQRMVRLNQSLLLLAKIENRQYALEDYVEINKLIAELAGELHDLSDYKNVKVEIQPLPELKIKANAELIRIMLLNLLKNAIIHTNGEGSVRVDYVQDSLQISNPGDQPLDADKIFDRFYKKNKKVKSTGLGLSIVKTIAVYHGFRLSYKFEDRHIFCIKLFP